MFSRVLSPGSAREQGGGYIMKKIIIGSLILSIFLFVQVRFEQIKDGTYERTVFEVKFCGKLLVGEK